MRLYYEGETDPRVTDAGDARVRAPPPTPPSPLVLSLRFQIKKRLDADAVLVLVREDGSRTTSEIGPAMGYGPVHDLAHFVVERTLRFSEGFLGLVASGWEVGDFEVRGAPRQLPPEALLAEFLAGELSREEMTRQFSNAEELAWGLEAWLRSAGPRDVSPPEIGATHLAAMRSELEELRGRWRQLPPSGTLELSFTAERRSLCARPVRAAPAAPDGEKAPSTMRRR